MMSIYELPRTALKTRVTGPRLFVDVAVGDGEADSVASGDAVEDVLADAEAVGVADALAVAETVGAGSEFTLVITI